MNLIEVKKTIKHALAYSRPDCFATRRKVTFEDRMSPPEVLTLFSQGLNPAKSFHFFNHSSLNIKEHILLDNPLYFTLFLYF